MVMYKIDGMGGGPKIVYYRTDPITLIAELYSLLMFKPAFCFFIV